MAELKGYTIFSWLNSNPSFEQRGHNLHLGVVWNILLSTFLLKPR